MSFQIFIVITLVIILFFLISQYRLKNKISKLDFKLEDLELVKRNIERKNEILNSISIALTNTQKNSIDFKQGMKHLVELLRIYFKSEYCAIGKITKIGDEIKFEDFAISFELKEDEQERLKQEESLEEVMIIDSKKPGYYITDAYEKEDSICYYNLINEASEIRKSPNLYIYIESILKSRNLNNTTILKLISKSKVVGYIQLINSKEVIDKTFLDDYNQSISQLVEFEIASGLNKKKLKEKSKLAKDTDFVTTLIKDETENIDRLLVRIMNYFNQEFNSAITTFRIPILNGRDKDILFYLRKIHVDKKLENSEYIEEYYRINKHILKNSEIGANGHFKCYLPEEIIYEEVSDISFYENYGLNKIINTQRSINLPILKEIRNKNCLKRNNNQCLPNEYPECKNRFENLFGVFKLRVYEPITDEKFLNKRLENLSYQLSFLFDSIIDKKNALDIKLMQSGLKTINLNDTTNFDKQISSFIKEITKSKVCSIYRMENTNECFKLSASTSTSVYNITSNIVEDIIEKKDLLLYEKASENIFSTVYSKEQSKYLYNLKNPEARNHYEIDYFRKYFPKFIEIPDYDKSYSNEDILLKIAGESIFILPLFTNTNNLFGFILLLGKEQNNLSISTSFWEQDRIFIELAVNIISRFADINEAKKEKEKFLNQLGHELLSPITEIIYENSFLVNKYARDKSIGKEIVIKQLSDNLNAAMLFKHILDDIEFGYDNSDQNYINIEKQDNPKEILLNIVKLFEKKASAEKQIIIKTNISNMPPMLLDKDRIKQVFINLIKNAIQYSYPTKTINIYYKQLTESFSGKECKSWHEIKFVNWGIGILESDKEKIFDLYNRSTNARQFRPSGTGIGLFIVKSIIEAHGGICRIVSLNNPTEISILLPNK